MTLELKQHKLGIKGNGPKPENFGDSFFIQEIQTQCMFVEIYFATMNEIFETNPTSIGLMAPAHGILVAASNVAKILSEPKKGLEKRKRRAVRLQQLLNCTEYDFSAIVDARNYLEHFDERIDRYLEISQPGAMTLRLVGKETHEFADVEGWGKMKLRYLQHLNTETLELTMMDEKINLGRVIQQSLEIGMKAKTWREAN